MDWDPPAGPGRLHSPASFNSPVGIRWIGTRSRSLGRPPHPRGFNSPVGIRWIGTHSLRGGGSRRRTRGFNSPVGIRWIGTQMIGPRSQDLLQFQFPSRNSMDWDAHRSRRRSSLPRRFQFPSRNSMDWDVSMADRRALALLQVSIPQSEFDGLGPIIERCVPDGWSIRFNSPVGIRWIGTLTLEEAAGRYNLVSIPQSEFDGLGLSGTSVVLRWLFCFNSPVGIRWIGTSALRLGFRMDARVSIPQSEFDGLGQGEGA